MNISRITAMTLRITVAIGILLMAAGLLTDGSDISDTLIWTGMLVLICSPLCGIMVTYAGLVSEKNRFWIAVATVLLLVLATDILLSVC